MNNKLLQFVLLLAGLFGGNIVVHAQISGTVYNDVNGLSDNIVNGTGTNAGGLKAVLVNATSGNVVAVQTVPASGAFSFTGVSSANYLVMITANAATAGNPAPAVLLPAGWVVTGEKLGSGNGHDGTPDGKLALGTTAAATNVNFGIEETPEANVLVSDWQANPGGAGFYSIPALQIGGTDPSGGSLDSMKILSFPTFIHTLKVGSNNYTSGSFPTAGLYLPLNAAGHPIPALAVDPESGNVDVVLDYTVMDNAGKWGDNGSLTIPFRDLVSGTVYNDVNGLTDNEVNGSGVDSGLVNVVLVDTVTDKVVLTTPVQPNGYFGFSDTSIHVGTPYRVLVTTNAAAVGANQPAVASPANWVLTGEYLGDGAGDDGNADGILYVGTLDSFINKAKLGIEKRPVTVSDTAANLDNPGAAVAVTIQANGFHGTDADGGHIDSLRIVGFPTHTTTMTVGGNPYTAATFPAGGITIQTNNNGNPVPAITIDPVDGAVMVLIPYTVIDNADKEDSTAGHLAIPFVIMGGSTAEELAQTLTGTGVVVLNPTLNGTCPDVARGVFNFFGQSDLGIDSGIVLTSGSVVTHGSFDGINNPAGNLAAYQFPPVFPPAPGDPDLDALLLQTGSTITTNDACVLEFDFVPAGDSIKFDYVFGSEEYPEYACSPYNDVFGFFISGPGFTGLNNLALVPGTNIPVAINSITDQTGASCTNMGPGSPFTQYYIGNQGGQQIVYDGFTTILTALAAVNPCDTYHLKLAIGDGNDGTLDSGVFLKAGSLSSTAISVKTYGGAGLETPFTNTVRGCPPGIVRISRNGNLTQPVTIPLMISGTATNGIDYQTIPNSVTIPAGDSAVSITVQGIPSTNPQGPESCIIAAISPYTCGNGAPVIISSDTIMIYDSIYVNILNPDTAICFGESVHLRVEADTMLAFHWTPADGLGADSVEQNITVTPDTATYYQVSVKLPLITGCPPSTDRVFVDVKRQPQVDLGEDVYTCGAAVQLYAATSPTNPDETFSWSPPGGLSNPNIRNPYATVTTTTQYVVTVNPGATGCDGTDTINVTLLPDHINVLNQDTAVCAGTVLDLIADGDEHFQYNWTPEADILNDTVRNTKLIARQSGYYTLTASFPGCVDMSDSFHVKVEPVPEVAVGPDRIICSYDTIQLYGSVQPANFDAYNYSWHPGEGLTDSTIQSPVYSGDASEIIRLVVTTPLGCKGADSLRVTVNPGDFLLLQPVDTGVCPPATVQLSAAGANSYQWSPSEGLDDSSSAHPIATPLSSTDYMVVGRSALNCYDTQHVFVQVYPAAVVHLPDSVTIWSGEQYQLRPQGNGLYYSWFPPSGLSQDDIANPIASPEVRTRYFVTIHTENDCVAKDSIDVLVQTETVLEVPNAFTPGHGKNGTFKILRKGMAKLLYFRIYNRWGNKVFETSDINQGWDGTFNGEPQPGGVYIYSIEAETATGKTFRKDGNVTLIR